MLFVTRFASNLKICKGVVKVILPRESPFFVLPVGSSVKEPQIEASISV